MANNGWHYMTNIPGKRPNVYLPDTNKKNKSEMFTAWMDTKK